MTSPPLPKSDPTPMKSAPSAVEQHDRLDVVPEHLCHLGIGNTGIEADIPERLAANRCEPLRRRGARQS